MDDATLNMLLKAIDDIGDASEGLKDLVETLKGGDNDSIAGIIASIAAQVSADRAAIDAQLANTIVVVGETDGVITLNVGEGIAFEERTDADGLTYYQIEVPD